MVLGKVKSTNYKSLTYVSKELLVKVGGETSLRGYAGFVASVAYKAMVDGLIARFEE